MDIKVSLNLPAEVESQIQGERLDFTEVAREAIAIELFRLGQLTHAELGRVLGLDRFDTDCLLKRHNVSEHALSFEDVEADIKSLRDFLDTSGKDKS